MENKDPIVTTETFNNTLAWSLRKEATRTEFNLKKLYNLYQVGKISDEDFLTFVGGYRNIINSLYELNKKFFSDYQKKKNLIKITQNGTDGQKTGEEQEVKK